MIVPKIKKICPTCNKEFETYPSENNDFCSAKCSDVFRRKRPQKRICLECGQEFEIKFQRESKRMFCSTSCSMKHRLHDPEYRQDHCNKNKGRKQSSKTRQKRRLSHISRIESLGIRIYPNWNPKACEYFRKYDSDHNTNGQYATNGGEYRIRELGYWVDYINHDIKLIMEYDEKAHFDENGNLKEKDISRQHEIQQMFPDYEFVRIRDE